MPANAAKLGELLHDELNEFQKKYPEVVGCVQGKGLVAGAHIVKDGEKEADYDLAFDVVKRCVEKGLLFFSPVGRATVKISPPLIINEEQVKDGAAVLGEAMGEVLAERN